MQRCMMGVKSGRRSGVHQRVHHVLQCRDGAASPIAELLVEKIKRYETKHGMRKYSYASTLLD